MKTTSTNAKSSRARFKRTGTEACRSSLSDNGYIAAGNLIPQKSRILLQLALTKTSDPKEIARIFSEY